MGGRHDPIMTSSLTIQDHTTNNITAVPWPARHLGLLTALAGTAWLALGLESIIRPEQHNYRDTVMNVPWLLTLAVVFGIHQRQRHRNGRLERWGFVGVVVSMIAAVGLVLPQSVGAIDTIFALTVPAWILSMFAFGIGTARAGVFPRWVGVGLAISELLTMGAAAAMSPWIPLRDRGSFSGAVAHGIVFLSIAVAINRDSATRDARD